MRRSIRQYRDWRNTHQGKRAWLAIYEFTIDRSVSRNRGPCMRSKLARCICVIVAEACKGSSKVSLRRSHVRNASSGADGSD